MIAMKETQNDMDLLSAYIDGELGRKDAAAVRARLESDTEFSDLFNVLTKSEESLKCAAHEIDAAPLPESLVKLLSEGPKQNMVRKGVVELFAEFIDSISRAAINRAVPVAALIAVITGVFLVDNRAFGPNPSVPAVAANAPTDLTPLHHLAAGEKTSINGGILTEILAFTRHDGSLCKHYVMDADAPIEAVACLSAGTWTNVAVGEASNASSISGYRMASGTSLPAIDTYIEANIAGGALTVEEERLLMKTVNLEQR